MRKGTTLSFALAAALCFAAFAAASASAALPEFSTTSTFTGSGGAGTLKTVGNATVKCTSNEVVGAPAAEVVGGTKEVKNGLIAFKGCESNVGTKCKNTTTAGEIRTATLKGQLGYVEPAALGGPVAVGLSPASGTTFAEFECATVKDKVTGCVLGKVTPVNTNTKEYALALAEAAGKQNITSYEPVKGAKESCKLAAALAGKASEEAGIDQTAKLVSAIAGEIKS